MPDTLDPEIVEGTIVVCYRGINARTEKSQVVADAGGIGMVLANNGMSTTSTNTEYHAVPTVHLTWADGQAVINAIGRDEIDPDATLELGVYDVFVGQDVTAPAIAGVLVQGPGAHGRRRHPQARHHGTGGRHPRLARSIRTEHGRELRVPVRDVHVRPAHCRPRPDAQAAAPGLVADGNQVGHGDRRISREQPRRPDRARQPPPPPRSTTAGVTSSRRSRRTPRWSTSQQTPSGSSGCVARTSSRSATRSAFPGDRSTRATSTVRRSP